MKKCKMINQWFAGHQVSICIVLLKPCQSGKKLVNIYNWKLESTATTSRLCQFLAPILTESKVPIWKSPLLNTKYYQDQNMWIVYQFNSNILSVLHILVQVSFGTE